MKKKHQYVFFQYIFLIYQITVIISIQLCVTEIFDNKRASAHLRQEDFNELLNLATFGLEFFFNNYMYKQINCISLTTNLCFQTFQLNRINNVCIQVIIEKFL